MQCLSRQTTARLQLGAASKPAAAVQRPARFRVRSSSQEEQPSSEAEQPQLTFQPNRQAESAYVAFDTAGQENMFPVTTRPYEVGSKDDSNATGGANLAIGVGAGVIAVGVIAAGLLVLGSSGPQVVEAPTDLKTLSEYAQLFSSQL